MSDAPTAAPAATLVIEMPDGLRQVAIGDLVTIGRDVASDVAIDHPTVSRQHARIAYANGSWRFEDVGSRNGTRGGVTPGLPFDLVDGAPIRIGRVRAWFFAGPVPSGWSPPEQVPTDGRLVRCRCGHVGWAPSFIDGMAVRCRKCKRRIFVEPSPAPPAGASAICAACRDAVAPSQPAHTCPSCGATMHADCRAELGGCATYGCDRVNELVGEETNALPEPSHETMRSSDEQWTLAALGFAGLPLFGLPAFAWIVFAMRRRRRSRASMLFAIVAGATGAAASAIAWPRVLGGASW